MSSPVIASPAVPPRSRCCAAAARGDALSPVARRREPSRKNSEWNSASRQARRRDPPPAFSHRTQASPSAAEPRCGEPALAAPRGTADRPARIATENETWSGHAICRRSGEARVTPCDIPAGGWHRNPTIQAPRTAMTRPISIPAPTCGCDCARSIRESVARRRDASAARRDRLDRAGNPPLIACIR